MKENKINNGTEKDSKIEDKMTKERLISIYMDSVLMKESKPTSVFKFCRENELMEDEFYQFFGSFEGLQIEIWNSFFQQAVNLIHKDDSFENFGNREKMLTFYYTFFEVLTLNRSYVLFSLNENREVLKNLKQLKGLRSRVKNFVSELIRDQNESQNLKLLKQPVSVFSEGAWLQTLFLLKYWMEDNSAGFENTDIAIEKSVRAIFDLFDNTPLESILDFGKFLWKEKTV